MKKNRLTNEYKVRCLAFALGFFASTTGFSQTLSQTPLEGAVNVDPNIMFILDDSLSMYSVIRDEDFDRGESYEEWEYDIADFVVDGPFFPDNIPIETVDNGTCPSGYTAGSRNGETRCLKLPDPIPGSEFTDTYYSVNYLNYLFETYSDPDSDIDLTDVIPGELNGQEEYRLQVLQNSIQAAVDSRDDIRWCISDLSGLVAETPSIAAECGADESGLTSAINGVNPPTAPGTPLAESYHEVTEFFRGLNGYTSPVQYRCQSNFVVLVTDGYPTGDIGDPAEDIVNETRAQHGLSGSESLPDWDGEAPDTTVENFDTNTIPAFSDGFGIDASPNGEGQQGSTLYLDDLALFGQEVDLFRTGEDDAEEPWGDATVPEPNDTSDFPLQNINTFTIGFGIENQMLNDAAFYGSPDSDAPTDGAFIANNATQLALALNSIVKNVDGLIGSSAASTATTAFLSSGDQVFQVKYQTGAWVGSLISFSLDSDPESPTFGQIDGVNWSTDDNFTNPTGTVPDRNLLTLNDVSGLPVPLEWSNLSAQPTSGPGKRLHSS